MEYVYYHSQKGLCMYNKDFLSNHTAYFEILKTRGLKGLQKDTPLWKLKLTDSEYDSIKQTLRSHTADLHLYGIEAALYYAEWWRRDYNGNIPSKEDVAKSLGLSRGYAEKLYLAAREALEKHKFTFIHSLKGTEYFRSLLNQGGLPVNYIKNNEGNSTSRRTFQGRSVRLYHREPQADGQRRVYEKHGERNLLALCSR